jgi:hypothetical protein
MKTAIARIGVKLGGRTNLAKKIQTSIKKDDFKNSEIFIDAPNFYQDYIKGLHKN